MVRSLFFREYRSGLAVYLAVPLVLISIFAAAGKNPQLEFSVLIADYLLPIVVALGFVLGERCFSSASKDKHAPFLRTLPVASSRIWLTIISARFIASLAGLGLLACAFAMVVHKAPFVVSTLSETHGSTFMLFLVSYLSGGAWSLLIRRPSAVYFFGLPFMEMILVELKMFVRSCLDDPTERIGAIDPDLLSRYWLGALGLLAAAAGLLSVYLFARLELTSIKRRIINFGALVAVLLVYSASLLALATDAHLASLLGEWVPLAYQFPRGMDQISEPMRSRGSTQSPIPQFLSADARYLAIPEYLTSRPWFARLSIIDTVTGAVVLRQSCQGLKSMGWHTLGPKDLLTIARVDDSAVMSLLDEPTLTVRYTDIDLEGRFTLEQLYGPGGRLPPDSDARQLAKARSITENIGAIADFNLTTNALRENVEFRLPRAVLHTFKEGTGYLLFDDGEGRRIWISKGGEAFVSDGGHARRLWPPHETN